MPLEGHWKTQNTPLRKLTTRERRAASGMVVATVLVLAALLLATGSGGQPQPGPGCIRVGVPGRTGGEVVSGCGREARALCTRASRFEGLRAELVVAACRERGIAFESAAEG